jgi:hypothetical protein
MNSIGPHSAQSAQSAQEIGTRWQFAQRPLLF